jgi:hypothetical protein
MLMIAVKYLYRIKARAGEKNWQSSKTIFLKKNFVVKSARSKKLELTFSLNSLLQFSKEEFEFNGSRSTLHKIFKSIGRMISLSLKLKNVVKLFCLCLT